MLSQPHWPRRRTRLLVFYLLTVLALLLVYTAVYRSFMLWFEGREPTATVPNKLVALLRGGLSP